MPALFHIPARLPNGHEGPARVPAGERTLAVRQAAGWRTLGVMADVSRYRDALSATLASQPDARWAYLFGSAARGGPFRDLDVALMPAPSARGAVALGGIIAALEDAVRDVKLDVVDLGAAPPALAGVIAREGLVLLDREPAERQAWEIQATRCALDIAPWLARYAALREAAARATGP